MTAPVENLADNTITFFSTLKMNLENIPSDRFNSSREYRNFRSWTEDCFGLLNEYFNRGYLIEIIQMSIQEDGTVNRRDAFDLLNNELVFYNTRYSEPIQMSGSEPFEAGGEVINSVKDIFDRLPKWLQKVLTAIAELLGIAKVLTGNPL